MSDEQDANLRDIPSPKAESEIRYAFLVKFSMLYPLWFDGKEAGFLRDLTYPAFCETLRQIIPDKQPRDLLWDLYFFQLLLESVESQRARTTYKPLLDLISKLFIGLDPGNVPNLFQILKGITTKLDNIEKELKDGATVLPDSVKDFINGKFETLERKIDDGFQADQLSLKGINERQGGWERQRTEFVQKYSRTFIKTEKLLSEIPDEWEEIAKLILKLIEEQVIEEIASSVVGASYSRWDNTSSYYPTIVFIFREVTTGNRPRTSQTQIKWKKPPSEITDSDIEALRARISAGLPLTYKHGKLRSNYVQSDKSWKTTVFADSKQDAVHVLTKLCSFLDQQVDTNQFSFTEGQKRTTITRRNTPLDGITPEYIDYKLTFQVELYRAVLLVNGIRKPLRLYQKPRRQDPLNG